MDRWTVGEGVPFVCRGSALCVPLGEMHCMLGAERIRMPWTINFCQVSLLAMAKTHNPLQIACMAVDLLLDINNHSLTAKH